MQDTVTIRTPSGCLADETRSNGRMYAGVFLVALAVGLAWFPYGALKAGFPAHSRPARMQTNSNADYSAFGLVSRETEKTTSTGHR